MELILELVVFSKGTQIRDGLRWLHGTPLRRRYSYIYSPNLDPAVFFNDCNDVK